MIKDLIHISEIRNYITKLTGVLVSQRAVKRWVNDGEILILKLPSDRRKKFTRKQYVLDFVRRYTEPKPEITFEEVWKKLYDEIKQTERGENEKCGTTHH